ncbi:MAG: aminoglycoside phosphotransferase family protein [Dehalococcoidia bacterium]
MHTDEVETDGSLVGRLIASQFPQWAALAIEPVESSGTDNAIYRLGDELAVRLPRRPEAVSQIEKEQRWLPVLAPQLPLAIPIPLGSGEPGDGYPWRWSVTPWFEGEDATIERLDDANEAATELAAFISALRRIDASAGPPPGKHNFFRGVPLALRDAQTRQAIEALHGEIDTGAAAEAWKTALETPTWDGSPVWIHGDLSSANLLALDGRLSAVIDFGGLGVGDPACDLMIAWALFAGESRDAFRAALAVDDATWARGRGWALSQALIFIPYYRDTNPTGVASARRMIEQVLADRG